MRGMIIGSVTIGGIFGGSGGTSGILSTGQISASP